MTEKSKVVWFHPCAVHPKHNWCWKPETKLLLEKTNINWRFFLKIELLSALLNVSHRDLILKSSFLISLLSFLPFCAFAPFHPVLPVDTVSPGNHLVEAKAARLFLHLLLPQFTSIFLRHFHISRLRISYVLPSASRTPPDCSFITSSCQFRLCTSFPTVQESI